MLDIVVKWSIYESVSDDFTGKIIHKLSFEGQNGVCQVTRAFQKEKARKSILIQMSRLICVHLFPLSKKKKKKALSRFCIYIRHKLHFLRKFNAYLRILGNKQCTKMKTHALGLDFYLVLNLFPRPRKWFGSFPTGRG